MTPTSWVCLENVHNQERLQHPWLIGPSSDVSGRFAGPMKWFGQATDILIKVFHSLPWALCPKLLNKHCWIPNPAYFVCTCIHCVLTPCLLEEIARMHSRKERQGSFIFITVLNAKIWQPRTVALVRCCGFWRFVQINTAFLRSKSSYSDYTFFLTIVLQTKYNCLYCYWV